MQAKLTESVPDREARQRLRVLLAQLTPKQRAAVDRVIAAEIAGESLASLLTGENAICSHTAYYKKGGWNDNAAWREALDIARGLSFDDRLQGAVRRAREAIVLASPEAARTLVAMLATVKTEDGSETLKHDPALVLRAAESILNRADRSTADRSGTMTVNISGDDIAQARDDAAQWERERFRDQG